MHLTQFSRTVGRKWMKLGVICSLLVILALTVSACNGGGAEPEPAATEPSAAEETEPAEEAEPTEEPQEEPTAAAEEEAEPTAEPEEETEATAEPEEEAEATAEPEEEATAAPEEEAEATAAPEEEGDAAAVPEDGEYIMTLAGCGCHFNRDAGALAGGNEFEGSFGVAYAANITPHPETGIGDWSEQEIVDALRLGVRPDGEQLIPAMPYQRFSVLSDQEAMAVAARLLSLEPVENDVPARELTSEVESFTPENEPPAEPPSDPVERGEQLVTVANCGDCHTPSDGGEDMYLAGGPIGDDEIAANITPHEETGIGSWSEAEIVEYMHTGFRPDGSLAAGSMADQIDQRFSNLTDEDAQAIAAYLKSIPAVENDPYEE